MLVTIGTKGLNEILIMSWFIFIAHLQGLSSF